MKFRVYLKDPDGFDCSIEEAAEFATDYDNDLSQAEIRTIRNNREDQIRNFLKKWVEYSECITIEFDTEEETAKVVER